MDCLQYTYYKVSGGGGGGCQATPHTNDGVGERLFCNNNNNA